MKPQRFEKGQEIVCVDDKWQNADDESAVIGSITVGRAPVLYELVTVKRYWSFIDDEWFLELEGFHPADTFGENAFEPVMPIKEVYELLNETVDENRTEV